MGSLILRSTTLRNRDRKGAVCWPLPYGRGSDFGRSALRVEDQRAPFGVVIDAHRLAVADLAFEQQPAQRRFNLLLYRTLQRPRPIGWVVADLHQVRPRRVGQLQANVPLL